MGDGIYLKMCVKIRNNYGILIAAFPFFSSNHIQIVTAVTNPQKSSALLLSD